MATSLENLTKQMEHTTTFCKFAIITLEGAAKALGDIGMKTTSGRMGGLLRQVKLDDKTELNLSEFIAIVEKRSEQEETAKQRDSEMLARHGLERFDRDSDGRISRDEVAEAIGEVYKKHKGKEMSPQEITEKMADFSFDKKGSVELLELGEYLDELAGIQKTMGMDGLFGQ